METACAFLVGIMVAGGISLILERNLIRFIFGLVLISNAINLLIFTVGGISSNRPPLLPEAGSTLAEPMANSLPQALVLTAIVIGFALLSFIFVLFYRVYQEIGTVDTAKMQFAEPVEPEEKVTPSAEKAGEPI